MAQPKQTASTPWCLPIVVSPKPTPGEIRLCIDFKELNKFAVREPYPLNTPAEVVADLDENEAGLFASFDAEKGYHQCPLDPESQDLATFITPFGRYKFLRAPYGVSTISDHYYRRMYEAVEGIP